MALPGTSGLSASTSKQAEALSLLDPEIDPSTMAPSTLVLALRKKRRDAKREQRSVARRSNLRASTLKTDAEIAEREKQSQTVVHRKGRKALHHGGEARGVRILSQAELIAEALEEEERNKEELQKWLRREEERKELRRVGRKRVRGPRWTWISRTVGKVVEVIDTGDAVETRSVEASQSQAAQQVLPGPTDNDKQAITQEGDDAVEAQVPATGQTDGAVSGQSPDQSAKFSAVSLESSTTSVLPAPVSQSDVQVSGTSITSIDQVQSTPAAVGRPGPEDAGPSSPRPVVLEPLGTSTLNPEVVQEVDPTPAPAVTKEAASTEPSASATENSDPRPTLQTATTPNQPVEPSQYTRNYLILSQIPGGLPAELALVLGSHVAWDEVKYVPARNRPINRRPPLCPFTGKIAKYRHPTTMIPYADVSGYREIEALLRNRYTWSEAGFWVGGEEDVSADGVGDVEGWNEAVNGGWMAGFPIPEPEHEAEVVDEEADAEAEDTGVVHEAEEVVKPVKRGRKRASEAASKPKASKGKKSRR
jgi:hypothetical protein